MSESDSPAPDVTGTPLHPVQSAQSVHPKKQLQAEFFEKFIENQERELEIRAQEAKNREQSDKHAFEHAGKVLEAQVKDRQAERDFHLRYIKNRHVYVVAMVFVIAVFLIGLAMLGKDEMAMDFLKTAVYLAAGGIGTYYYGKHRGASEQQSKKLGNSNNDDDE